MGRTLLCSLAGAGVGFLVGFGSVLVVAGSQHAGDAATVAVFVGVFLAGSGAIAGAIIGGVADLREFFTKKGQPPQDRDESDLGSS
jgi:hypothetical protein